MDQAGVAATLRPSSPCMGRSQYHDEPAKDGMVLSAGHDTGLKSTIYGATDTERLAMPHLARHHPAENEKSPQLCGLGAGSVLLYFSSCRTRVRSHAISTALGRGVLPLLRDHREANAESLTRSNDSRDIKPFKIGDQPGPGRLPAQRLPRLFA